MLKVSIIGCGWLGKAFVDHNKNSHLFYCTISQEASYYYLISKNIDACKLILKDNYYFIDNSFLYKIVNSDVIIISIPPKRIDNIENYYPSQMNQLCLMLKQKRKEFSITKHTHVIFWSSTSVYPEFKKEIKYINEMYSFHPKDTIKQSGIAVRNAEKILQSYLTTNNNLLKNKSFTNMSYTIMRLGGLIGENRNAQRFLEKRNHFNLHKYSLLSPVNWVHQNDASNATKWIIENKKYGIYNIVAPYHPLRAKLYINVCEKSIISYEETFSRKCHKKIAHQWYNSTSKIINPINHHGKIISTNKIIQEGFAYCYENPEQFAI